MNPDIKAKWLETLRSGRYTQGKHWLRSEDGYCCLGVLADVCGVEWREDVDGCYVMDKNYSKILSDAFLQTVGWTAGTPQKHFSCLNDRGASFAEIADEIEKLL